MAQEEAQKHFADMRGEIAGLKSQLARRDAEDRKADMLIAAEDALRGYPLGADDRADIALFADRGDKAALDRYIAAFKRHAVPDSDADFERAVASGRGAAAAELKTFADRGPEALAEAKRMKPIYDELRRKGRTPLTFSEFVEASQPLNPEEK